MFLFLVLQLKLLKNNNINDFAIKQSKNKQVFYKSIYNLGLLKFNILKIYIMTYLKIGFI